MAIGRRISRACLRPACQCVAPATAVEALEVRRLMCALDHLDSRETESREVNAAGTVYVDAGNTVAPFQDAAGQTTWGVDVGFLGGKRVRGRFAVAATDDDPLFATRRQAKAFAYSVPAADGNYTLSLLFVDTLKKPGRRLFNVDAEGQRVENSLDIAARVGRRTALVTTHNVIVTGGALDLAFTAVKGKAVVSGFSLVPAEGTGTPVPPEGPRPPASPSGLTAAVVGERQVRLAWSDNAGDETAHLVERATNGGAFEPVATLAAGATQHDDLAVEPGNAYAYRVRALNEAGASEPSNEATVTTTPDVAARWVNGAAAPVELGEVAGGVIGDTLYLVGAGSRQTLAYDVATGAWRSGLAPRPHAGDHHAAEVVGGKLYLFGGFNDGSAGTVQIYDPAADRWTLGTPTPFPAGSASSAVIGGRVYVAGGVVNFQPGMGGQTTARAAVYDPATDAWSPIADMPRGVNHAASASDGQRFYVFGGRGGTGGLENGFGTVQVYDPATNTWRTSDDPASGLAPLPQGRGGTGKAVFAAGEFYVLGGETRDDGGGATPDGVYDRVDVYDPSTNAWRAAPKMPTGRHGIFPLLHGDRIYVAAGGTQAGFSRSTLLEILEL